MTLNYVLCFFAVSIGDNLGKYVILGKWRTAVCHLHLRSWFSHPSPTVSTFWCPSVPIWWSLVRCTVTQQTYACLKRMLGSFIALRIEIVKIDVCVCKRKNEHFIDQKKCWNVHAVMHSVTGSPTSFLLLLTQCAHGWLVDCDSQLIIAHRDMQLLSSWWSDNCSNVVSYEIRGLGDDVATCGLHPVPTEGPCCES